MSNPPPFGSFGDQLGGEGSDGGQAYLNYPQPVRWRSRRLRWAMLAAAAAALAVIVVVTGLVTAHHSGHPGQHREGELSGDRREWTAAVCSPGSASRPSSVNFRFPDAANSVFCTALSKPGEAPISLLIGEWPADIALDRVMAPYRSVHYAATGNAGDHTVIVASIDSTDRAVLEPLAPFGFTITALG